MLKKTMKATVLSFAVFASVVMIVALVITSIDRNAAAGIPASAPETQTNNGYLLRAYNGHLAVFYGEIMDSPAIETTIEVENLRAVDREKLEEGIHAQSYDDVLNLLEDFGS